MTTQEPILCPDCGWSGTVSELESDEGNGTYQCPACDAEIKVVE